MESVLFEKSCLFHVEVLGGFLLYDVLFKATNCTTGYNIAWRIATVGSCIGWLVDATFSFMKVSAFVGSDKE